jgi:hypothetical protein
LAKRNESDAWKGPVLDIDLVDVDKLGVPEPTVPVDQRTGLRLMIYDKRSLWRRRRPDLTPVWALGGLLYRVLRRIDRHRGVSSWAEAFDWIASVDRDRPIEEIQFWGHGLWGLAKIGEERFDHLALSETHEHAARLDEIRRRMLPDGRALWWFRTCLTLGARPGQQFAAALADRLGCRVGGHTHVIAGWQSGLHTLEPGCTATWCENEGIARGGCDSPLEGKWSSRRAPNTITFLHGKIPAGY